MKIAPILFSFLFFQFHTVYSQQAETKKNLYNLHDSVIGYQNLPLINGVELIEKYRTINDKHQFFKDRDFLGGSLNYNGQIYYDVQLKYDIFRDLLFIKLEDNSGTRMMELIKEKVKGFKIQEHTFEKLEFKNAGFNPGFYEVILDIDNLKLYKKRSLKPAEKRDMKILYYEFEKQEDEYIFYKPGTGYFEPKSSVLNSKFPSCSTEIKQYSSTNKNTRQNSTDLYMIGLGRLLNKIDCSDSSY